jgi:biotin transport system substrate-specific component
LKAITHNERSGIDTTDITLTALYSALIAVCSWISVPAAVPFTMQTFAVFVTVGVLGGKRGTYSVLLYLLLGAAGLPVLAGFTGGVGHLFGATGGYIIGFLFSAIVMWLMEAGLGRSSKVLIASMAAGLLVCYIFGTVWFVTLYTKESGSVSVMTALGWCVFPYVIPDALKIALAAWLTRRLRPVVSGIERNH